MLAQERFERILEILREKQSVTVVELTEKLNTSESTIRRDLT
ncbi:MAG: DeoR family transcriptional regulator, partial [Anaerobutyricum sp.]